MAKIKFGLSNVHYAVLTDEEKLQYGEVKKIPGAVKLALSAEGDKSNFYADNMAYFTTMVNNGFSGDLEMALITDDFKKDVLGYVQDEDTGLLLEDANALPKPIALLYQFETDEKARKVVLYKVTVGRPGMEHNTKKETMDPETETIPITVTPIMVNEKAYTKGVANPESKNYGKFYTSVVIPKK